MNTVMILVKPYGLTNFLEQKIGVSLFKKNVSSVTYLSLLITEVKCQYFI